MQPTTHLDPHMSVDLPSGLYHVRSGRILQQSRPNQEVTPLPGIYFFDGWYDPAWTFRPTCPGRRIHPNMTPSSQRQLLPLLNHHRHRTKKPETYLPRQFETRLRMDLAHGGQQFEHISTCMPWSVNTAHSSRKYMRPPKNTPHAAKASRNPSNTGLNRKNSLLSHHNSRLSCYTACPPCLTWPLAKITINLDTASQWVSKMRMSTFSAQITRTPPYKPLKYRTPLEQ